MVEKQTKEKKNILVYFWYRCFNSVRLTHFTNILMLKSIKLTTATVYEYVYIHVYTVYTGQYIYKITHTLQHYKTKVDYKTRLFSCIKNSL